MRCQNNPDHLLAADARADARFCSAACRAAWHRRQKREALDEALAALETGATRTEVIRILRHADRAVPLTY